MPEGSNTRAAARRRVAPHPGQWSFGAGAVDVTTVLGACVAVLLWHLVRRMGISHFILPSRPAGVSGSKQGRYGDEAFIDLSLQGSRQ